MSAELALLQQIRNKISGPTTAIVNRYSDGNIVDDIRYAYTLGKKVLSGYTTNSLLKTVLDITGSGIIDLLCLCSNVGQLQTIRLKLTIDGIVVFDATSPVNGNLIDIGMFALGAARYDANGYNGYQPTPFRQSCKVEVSSNQSSGTDLLYIVYNYRLNN